MQVRRTVCQWCETSVYTDRHRAACEELDKGRKAIRIAGRQLGGIGCTLAFFVVVLALDRCSAVADRPGGNGGGRRHGFFGLQPERSLFLSVRDTDREGRRKKKELCIAWAA